MGSAFLLCLGSTVCLAESEVRNPYMYERFTLHGGIQKYSVTGEFNYKKEGQKNYDIDLNDLGLDEHLYAPYVAARLRLSKRISFHMGYFGYHEDADKKNKFYFEWGDLVVPINAITDSEIDLDVYFVNLAYSVYSTANTEIGIGIGVHAADFSLEISAYTNPVLPMPPTTIGEETEDFLAPLPNLYLFATRAIKEKLLLHLNSGWMSMKYDEYDGNLFFVRALLEYRFRKNFGIGGGYSYFHVDVEYDPGHKVETYDVDFTGPLAYLTFGF